MGQNEAEAGKRHDTTPAKKPDGKPEPSDESTKTQDLAKAGRENFDPNAGQE